MMFLKLSKARNFMRFVQSLMIVMACLASASALAGHGAWGRGQDGGDYCYPADDSGHVIPNSNPIPDYVCGGSSEFGRSTAGGYACFPTKGDGTPLANRDALPQSDCERYGYKWGRDQQGGTQCFPLDKAGRLLPGLEAVANSNCF
jgi:hypothetical protein